MGSLPERLAAMELTFAREAEDLRGQIAALTVRPGDVERDLERLRIAGEVFAEVPAEDGPEPAADEPVVPRPGRGVPAVEPWRPDADQAGQLAGLPRAYRDVPEVIDDAGMPLRSVDVRRSLGIGAGHGEAEAMRGKLRRPAERGWCVTPEPGRFALAPGVYRRMP
jgi:hypothetical protein